MKKSIILCVALITSILPSCSLNGNNTTYQEVNEICTQTLEDTIPEYANHNSEQNNPTWLNGTWRAESDEGYIYWIFDNGKCTTYFECYPHVQEEFYSIDEGRIIIEGSDVSMKLDCARDIVIADGGCEWTKISDSTTIDTSLQGADASAENYSDSYSNSYSDEDLSWLDGNWRYQMTVYGSTNEIRVGISGNTIVVLIDGECYYMGDFSIDGNTLRYNSRNGSSDYLIIDRTNKYLMVDENNRMDRF